LQTVLLDCRNGIKQMLAMAPPQQDRASS
jgi:hypothetical protein